MNATGYSNIIFFFLRIVQIQSRAPARLSRAQIHHPRHRHRRRTTRPPIGFPTANLGAHNEQFPPDGVYAVEPRQRRPLRGVANIGVRPTLRTAAANGSSKSTSSTSRHLYGQDLEVSFRPFLRPEQKFATLEDLRTQIARRRRSPPATYRVRSA